MPGSIFFQESNASRSFSVCSTLFPVLNPHRYANLWICVSTGKAGTPNHCVSWQRRQFYDQRPARLQRFECVGYFTVVLFNQNFRQTCDSLRFHRRKAAGFNDLAISSTESFIISNGLSASLKARGVVLFTRTSVHCADSNTAINNVYASLWSSGMGGLGWAYPESGGCR